MHQLAILAILHSDRHQALNTENCIEIISGEKDGDRDVAQLTRLFLPYDRMSLEWYRAICAT